MTNVYLIASEVIFASTAVDLTNSNSKISLSVKLYPRRIHCNITILKQALEGYKNEHPYGYVTLDSSPTAILFVAAQ